MLKDKKNSNKQGDVGMGIAIGWFAQNEYTVCIPLTDSQDYDLIVERDGVLERVQVKTTSYKTPYDNYKVELRVKGGNKSGTGKTKNFDCSKVESVFIVTQDNEKYYIPTVGLNNCSSITLGEQYKKYKV